MLTAAGAADISTQNTVASTTLPLELVSLILDYIPEDMKWSDTLYNCALVSSAWRQLSQAHLFSTASLSTTAVCKAWNDKLDEFPHLALYVTTLSLWGGDVLLPRFPNIRNLILEEFSIWGDTEQALISQFHQVEKLHVDVRFSEPEQLLALTAGMRRVRDLFVGDLGFCRWNVTENDKPQMERMYEVGTFLESWNPHDVTPICLEKLKLSGLQNQTDLLMWFSSPSFDLSRLQVLTLDWRAGTIRTDTGTLSQFVSTVGRFVRHLFLFSDGVHSDLFPDTLASTRLLNKFISLETIAIADTSYSRDSWQYSLGLILAKKLLSTAPPTLKEVHIGMYIVFDGDHTLSDLGQLAEWSLLDQLLTGPKFSGLRYFNLHVKIHAPHGALEMEGRSLKQTKQAVFALIEDLLPITSSRRLLKLSVRERSLQEVIQDACLNA
ncbi:hypothetical protein VNI00_006597 [Paramarasmius palmivorus]|uniref:F-box domain-containing protein n=1 Tax=Paramarasmius palmivorus TaxID=297713 RepID=A0AAW0D9Y7_9AGAR